MADEAEKQLKELVVDLTRKDKRRMEEIKDEEEPLIKSIAKERKELVEL